MFDLYPWGTPKCCKSQGAESFKLMLKEMWYMKLLGNWQGCRSSSTKPTIVPKAADLPACRCSYKWGWQATDYSEISTPVDFRAARWGYIAALKYRELRKSKLSRLKEKVVWKTKWCCSILLFFGKCKYPVSKNHHLDVIHPDFKWISIMIPHTVYFCRTTRC